MSQSELFLNRQLIVTVAGLTIVYFFFLILHRIRPVNEKTPYTMLWRRTATKYLQWSIESFQQTGGRFLNGALVFATAMLGATVARYYAFQKHQDEVDADDVSFYTFLGSAFMSTFCVFPCLVLQTVADQSESRYTRLFLWCTTIGLAAAVWALSLPSIDYFLELTRAFDNYEAATKLSDLDKHDYDLLVAHKTLYRPGIYRALIWEKHCDSGGIRHRLRTLLTVGLIVQAPGFIYSLFTSLVAATSPWRSDPFHRLHRRCGSAFNLPEPLNRIVRLVIGTIYLAFALLFLASFIQYRHIVKNLAPSTDADIDWSFGQILALAQWAPVGLELMSAWRSENLFPLLSSMLCHAADPCVLELHQEERNKKRNGQSLNTSYELVPESQSVRGAS